ncbi:ankyrin repeat containing protein [Ixodes scapularis]|uniref:Ankyrin repeat containing protein n=1 Tax=Ixodes scapularis TaxID=6945 RepID=B7PX83_IXOSC|nr:ankyrin repeat containing protein [Ixodes scapularis]|eukprot:XP_002399621.1 ankyrin repeat containing protein [Ixodes scapularis]
MTPLFAAAQQGQLACLQFLLDTAKDRGQETLVDRGAEDKATPFMIAVQKGHLDCATLLLKYGADPNRRTTDNITALHLAVQSKTADAHQPNREGAAAAVCPRARLNYERSQGCPSNECLLVTLNDYGSFVRVLRLGLDPRLCLGGDADTEGTSSSIFLNCLFHPAESQEHILAVFKTLRMFLKSPTSMKDLTVSGYRRAAAFYGSALQADAWEPLLNSLEQPLPLTFQCRVSMRNHLMRVHGHFFEEVIPKMVVPQSILDFVLYSECGPVDMWTASG